jgi:hypothetical protein
MKLRCAGQTSRLLPMCFPIEFLGKQSVGRVNAFADFDFCLGNKRVRVLLPRKGFYVALAGLAGVVAKPSMALFAGRCFPCAFAD